jgi:hypothetical protein
LTSSEACMSGLTPASVDLAIESDTEIIPAPELKAL